MTIHDIKLAGIKMVQGLCRVCRKPFDIPEFKLKSVIDKKHFVEGAELQITTCRCPVCVKNNIHTGEAYNKFIRRQQEIADAAKEREIKKKYTEAPKVTIGSVIEGSEQIIQAVVEAAEKKAKREAKRAKDKARRKAKKSAPVGAGEDE